MTDERPTPETDKAKCKFTSLFGDDEDAYWVPLKLARCLERERDEARQVSGEMCDLCGWAMKFPEQLCRCELELKLKSEHALADRLAALLQRNRDQYGGQLIDSDCDCSDCEYLGPIDEALTAWKEARSE